MNTPNHGGAGVSVGHTPGPWHASPPAWARGFRQDGGKRAITAAGKPGVVANAYGEGNARLIAAAPDMKAASRSTVDRLADFPRWLRANGARTLAAILEEELAKHNAALARAEGRSS